MINENFIDKLFLLPANTKFWNTNMQSFMAFIDDKVIRCKHMYQGDPIFFDLCDDIGGEWRDIISGAPIETSIRNLDQNIPGNKMLIMYYDILDTK